jgi:hypothetical protein
MWEEFLVYERAVNEAFTNQSIIDLCSYGLDTCSGQAVADVMQCHQFGLAKRHGQWRLIDVRRQDYKAYAVAEPGLFAASGWQCGLRWLIEDRLAIYIAACPERISLKGAHVHLSESLAKKLGPLFQELVVNTAKYGALPSTQGKLLVQWRAVVNGSRNLHIKWSESGISNPTIPNNIGLGTQLIAGALQNYTRAFDGMECTFDLTPDARSLEVWLPFK